MVPMFKWGNERSNAVASPLFHMVGLRSAAGEEVQERSFEALRRNVGADLRKDIPGNSMAPTRLLTGLGDDGSQRE